MSDCDYLSGCAFFNEVMNDKAAIGDVLRHKYCLGDNQECARLSIRAKLGAHQVPPTLWPNDAVAAESMLKAAGAYAD